MSDDNHAAFAALDAMIATVNAIPGLGKRAAVGVALAVKGELERTIAAGTTPYGEAWEPTAKGKTPLRNAAKSLAVYPSGAAVMIKIIGVEARHHLGAVRGKRKRQIIPSTRSGGIPPAMADVIRKVLVEHFERLKAAAGKAA